MTYAQKKDTFKRLPRMEEFEHCPTTGALRSVEPETFQKCPHWSWFENERTKQVHKRPCGKCRHCRYAKHERIVGSAQAEAAISPCTLSLTLTYAPIQDAEGNKVDPDGAKHLNYEHIRLFLMRLRKQGYKFKKICAGEYGSKDGRAHWHLLLFFEWSPEIESLVLRDVRENTLETLSLQKDTWRDHAPPMMANLSGNEFVERINDPNVLVVSLPMKRGKTAKIRNTWKFWDHGLVEGQLVASPENRNPEQVEGGVRYICKYLSKDAWKDSKKWKNKPFDELPEHVKHQTRFGVWYTPEEIEENRRQKGNAEGDKPQADHEKWRLGNDYVKGLEEQLRKEFPEHEDDVPIDRRIKRGQYHYKAKGGLGGKYFWQLGRWHAKNGGESFAKQTYKIGGNYRAKQNKMVERKIQEGVLPETLKKRFDYYMSKTGYRQFWEGFNEQQRIDERPETTGPDHVYDDLDTQAKKASDLSSGPIGLAQWNQEPPYSALKVLQYDEHGQALKTRREVLTTKQRNQWRENHRDALAKRWGEMTDEQLRGYVPSRIKKHLIENSRYPGWQKRKQNELWKADHGKVRRRTKFAGFEIIETDRKFLYRRYLETKYDTKQKRQNQNTWFEKDINTVHELALALQGKLRPDSIGTPVVKQSDKQKREEMDKKLIDLDIRTVRRRIKKRVEECPF